MANDTKDITVLNTLIGTLLDSIDGYEKSAHDVVDVDLAEKFLARARERQSVFTQLRSAVTAVGGVPDDDSTVLGGIHRAFLSVKEAVLGRDDKAIVNEIERGEDYLKEKFKAAMSETDMSPFARCAVDEAWFSVKAGHDEMSAL